MSTIVLAYVGKHKGDSIWSYLGYLLIKTAQSGKYKNVTHTELVLAGNNYKHVIIASSSLLDKGVRVKSTQLTKGNWIAIRVECWDVELAKIWFENHLGDEYDVAGAMGSVLPIITGSIGKQFCSQSCAAPFLETPEQYCPSELMAIIKSLPGSIDITNEFFED